MFGERLFQTKLLSRLSHKVCRLLSSPVLLRKFTIYSEDTKRTELPHAGESGFRNGKKFACGLQKFLLQFGILGFGIRNTP